MPAHNRKKGGISRDDYTSCTRQAPPRRAPIAAIARRHDAADARPRMILSARHDAARVFNRRRELLGTLIDDASILALAAG